MKNQIPLLFLVNILIFLYISKPLESNYGEEKNPYRYRYYY